MDEQANPHNKPIAVVTGGGSGIGRAIVKRLVEEGYSVLSIDKTAVGKERGVTDLQVDLLDEVQLSCLIDELSTQNVGVLVNNAAIALTGPCDSISIEAVRRSMTLNVEVPLRLFQAVVPGMKAHGVGRIVNIASRAALGKPLRTAYAASKGGLISMTRTWALELAPEGITVNCIAPGPIATKMFMDGNPEDSITTRNLLNAVPLRRLGSPEDIAHAVSYLVDPRCGFVTGQTLYVCGGLTVGTAG